MQANDSNPVGLDGKPKFALNDEPIIYGYQRGHSMYAIADGLIQDAIREAKEPTNAE